MKILLINRFHYRKGGSEAVYFNTAELLQKAGHKVIFFSFTDNKNVPCEQSDYFVNSSVSRIKGMMNYFFNSEVKQKLELLIEKEKPDIAHVHLIWGGVSPAIFSILKKHHIPLIHTAHDYRMICPAYTFNCNGHICEECAGKHFYKCAIKKCSKGKLIESSLMALEMYERNIFFKPENNFSGIIYVSKFSKDKHLLYRPQLGRVHSMVQYNCSQEPPAKLLNKFNRSYYLFFGRLSYEKGVDKLIDVFAKLPNLKLKIVGTGPLETGLKEKVNSLNIKNIEFAGYKCGYELQSIIANASFVIVPSQWYENNPMTIIESYSLQTPVIGADLGGIPEIIDNGKTGYIFDHNSNDDLVKLLCISSDLNDVQYKEMSRNARTFYDSNFSQNGYAEKLVEFYNSVIKQS